MIYRCQHCGIEVEEIPVWKRGECSKNDARGHIFRKLPHSKKLRGAKA